MILITNPPYGKCRVVASADIRVNREIAKYVDVMIGNEEDFTKCLGSKVEGIDKNRSK